MIGVAIRAIPAGGTCTSTTSSARGCPGTPRGERPAGCRNHLLVLPSVVCATRVAADIAEALGGVTITHQHGCSQVGDDGVRTRDAFEQIACNPNVAAALVVGLGCETMQGAALAAAIGARGQRVEFVGIQEQGGSRAACASGVEVGGRCSRRRPRTRGAGARRTVIGIEASHASPLASALVRARARRGRDRRGRRRPRRARRPRSARRFGAAAPPGAATVLTGAGHGAQQHVALAAAGAQVIVAFPALDDAPVGFPVCPVIAVAGGSALHAALGDDFDLRADATRRRRAVVARRSPCSAGAQTAAEARGSRVFALERLAMSM